LAIHPGLKREGATEAAESKIDARPNFAMIIFPGYLTDAPICTGKPIPRKIKLRFRNDNLIGALFTVR
jgi:hypothetical protein